MLTVHHLNNSRSQRIVWLCEELGIPYALVKHQRDAETLRSPDSLKHVHVLGKAPAIEHNGLVIIETDAIIEYICNACAAGRLRKDGERARRATRRAREQKQSHSSSAGEKPCYLVSRFRVWRSAASWKRSMSRRMIQRPIAT